MYADLTADVTGFEELMRIRIIITVGQCCREVDRGVLEGWLNMHGEGFERFIIEICGWGVDGRVIKIPVNKENEAKGTVLRENVQFDRMYLSFRGWGLVGKRMVADEETEFAKIIHRAYEQPA